MRINNAVSVPSEWGLAPLKRLTRFGYGEALAADDRDANGSVSVYGSNGPFDHHSTANTEAPCIIVGRKGSYGKCHYSENAVFAVDTTFVIDRRHTSSNLRYVFHLLSVLGLDDLSDDTAVPGLSREKAYQSIVPLPPFEAQKRIAAFLDEKTNRIDGLIGKKRALLERLAEKRQAIITHAVTKGLNPAAPKKDSGIEWLGHIPAHWEVRRIKELGTLIGGAGFPHEYQGLTDLELPFFKVMDLGLVSPNEPLTATTNTIDRDTARTLRASIIEPNDIVFAKVGAALLLNRFRKIGRHCCIDNNMMAFHPGSLIDAEFALQTLSRINFSDIVNPGAVPSINGKQIGELCVALPPLSEQAAITAQVLEQSAILEHAEAKVAESLRQLAEYRSALITAAVTGQIEGLR